MRIAQLRYFVTIAQLENMSQAAELLHLSQSSLSKNLATLEDELGIPLFQRNGRKLVLNPAGARMLEFAKMVLRELEFAVNDMRLLSTGAEARIRIGTAGAGEELTRCLAEFRKTAPYAEYELTGGIEGIEHLDINEYDMLIYPSGRRYQKFTGFPLYEERYALAVPSKHPLAKSPSVRPKAAEDQDVIFLRNGRSAEEFPFQICSALALRFHSISYADSRELHRQMIADGLCLGFVPVSCSAFYQGDGTIRLIHIQDERFTRQMMVCFRREKHLSPLARELRDFVMDYFSVESTADAARAGTVSGTLRTDGGET